MTDRNLLLSVGLIISVMLLTNVAIAESTDGETDVYYEKNTSSPSVHLLNAPSSVHGSDELDVTVGWSNIPTDWELIVSLEKSEANKDRLADDVNRTISGSGEATFKLNVYPVNETYNQTRIWACLIDDNKEWANVFTDIGIIVIPALPPQPTTVAPSIQILNSPYSVNGSTELDVTVGWNNIPADWELIVSLEKSGTDKNRLADDVNRIVSGSGETTFKLNVYPVDETYNQTRICACLLDDDREWANIFTDIGIIVIPALPPQPQPSTFILPEYMLAATLFLAVLILIKSRKKTIAVPPSIKPVPPVHKLKKEPTSIDIKRGYEVLSNNDLRFGIRIANSTDYVIMDVEILLDYDQTLFLLKSDRLINLANIHPHSERTATYTLTPLGCVHNEAIGATIIHKDHTGKKHTVQMRSKEVHCVCPFLKGKAMTSGEFAKLADKSESIEEGTSFSGISVLEVSDILRKICVPRLHVIGEHEIDDTKIVYLAGESIGEKAYYLLTAVIQPYKSKAITQIALRAYSDKPHGLHGFLDEISGSVRHLVGSVQSAKEIGIIENNQVINIIDSVVQRTKFETMGGGGTVKIDVTNSVLTRNKIGGDDSVNKEIAPIIDNKQSAVTDTDVNSETIGNIQTLEFQKIYEYLVDVARKGCKIYNTGLDLHNKKERQKLRDQKIIVTYGDVLERFGEKPDNRKAQGELIKILDKINEKNEPALLSALVVRKKGVVREKDFLPGERFFLNWLPLTNDEDKLSAWGKELVKIWQQYCK